MTEEIYLHGIYPENSFKDNSGYYLSLFILEKILSSNYLLSARLRKEKTNNKFNGMDYISLCDYQKRNIVNNCKITNYNAYYGYIKESISLIFPKNKFEVIIPKLVPISTLNSQGFELMKMYGNSTLERYSDFPDEVQVKDKISLSYMTGITIPLDKIIESNLTYKKQSINIENIYNYIKQIELLLSKYKYNVPIFDIDNFENINSKSKIMKLVKNKNN